MRAGTGSTHQMMVSTARLPFDSMEGHLGTPRQAAARHSGWRQQALIQSSVAGRTSRMGSKLRVPLRPARHKLPPCFGQAVCH